MLTSKEIIERTGISRATLNNYISCGLVPRPQVLPPGPEHGAAPRIGYFPDDTIVRVETIQRLKREGWSINRIAEHFSGRPGEAAVPAVPVMPAAPAVPLPPAAASILQATAALPAADPAAWRLTLENVDHPTYLVDGGFRLVWLNDPARASVLSPLAGQSAARGSIFGHLLALEAGGARDAILQFHLETAKDRAAAASELFDDLGPEQQARLQALFRQARTRGAGLVRHVGVPPAGNIPARLLHAVHFREAVAFAFTRQEHDEAMAVPVPRTAGPAPAAHPPAAPAVTSIGVLVSTLQDANALWVKLTAHEYYELVNEVWAELDPIFRRHGGQPGRHPDEGLVCYFLPQPGTSYVWNALAAAQGVRDAMHQVSRRWQARKGWDLELCMNTGLDEGQDWMGAIGAAGAGDLRVLGDAADRAEQLSRCARLGAVLVTRSLLGKLSDHQRRRIVYGVPRPAGTAAGARLLSSFARLADLASAAAVPARVADLAVAELLAIETPAAEDNGAVA